MVDAGTAAQLAKELTVSNIEVKVFSDLGHQLGEHAKGKFGPMSPLVLDVIADWCG